MLKKSDKREFIELLNLSLSFVSLCDIEFKSISVQINTLGTLFLKMLYLRIYN